MCVWQMRSSMKLHSKSFQIKLYILRFLSFNILCECKPNLLTFWSKHFVPATLGHFNISGWMQYDVQNNIQYTDLAFVLQYDKYSGIKLCFLGHVRCHDAIEWWSRFQSWWHVFHVLCDAFHGSDGVKIWTRLNLWIILIPISLPTKLCFISYQ